MVGVRTCHGCRHANSACDIYTYVTCHQGCHLYKCHLLYCNLTVSDMCLLNLTRVTWHFCARHLRLTSIHVHSIISIMSYAFWQVSPVHLSSFCHSLKRQPHTCHDNLTCNLSIQDLCMLCVCACGVTNLLLLVSSVTCMQLSLIESLVVCKDNYNYKFVKQNNAFKL